MERKRIPLPTIFDDKVKKENTKSVVKTAELNDKTTPKYAPRQKITVVSERQSRSVVDGQSPSSLVQIKDVTCGEGGSINRKYIINDFLDLSDEPYVDYKRITYDKYVEYVKWYKKKHDILEEYRDEHAGTSVEKILDKAENILDKKITKIEESYPDSHLVDVEELSDV